MTEDEYKLDNPFHNELPELPKEDFFINGHILEFFNEDFYCNNERVNHEIMIEIIDFIDNVNHNIGHHKNPEPLFIKIFNMNVNINVLEQVYREFEKTY